MSQNPILQRVRIALGLIEGTPDVLPEIPVVEEKPMEFAVEAILIDGVTKIAAETFEVGQPLFVIAEDGTATPAPEGVHETADLLITVDALGVITDVTTKAAPAPEVETPEIETPETETETMMIALESIVTELKALKDKMATMESQLCKTEANMEKFSKAPATEKITSISLKQVGKEETNTFEKKLEILKEIKKNIKH